MIVNESDIFVCFCEYSVGIMNFIKTFPTAMIAKSLDCSYYMANKRIKALVKQGLLEYGIEKDYNEEYGTIVIQGYHVTQKGRKDNRYRKALWKEAKLCSECFGGGSPYSYWKGFNLQKAAD